MKAKLENEVNMDLKSSKISPRELHMRPTWTPKGALEASRRPLGAESGFRELFGVILDPFGPKADFSIKTLPPKNSDFFFRGASGAPEGVG